MYFGIQKRGFLQFKGVIIILLRESTQRNVPGFLCNDSAEDVSNSIVSLEAMKSNLLDVRPL